MQSVEEQLLKGRAGLEGLVGDASSQQALHTLRDILAEVSGNTVSHFEPSVSWALLPAQSATNPNTWSASAR